jgi:hypothetical protein
MPPPRGFLVATVSVAVHDLSQLPADDIGQSIFFGVREVVQGAVVGETADVEPTGTGR